MSELYIVAYDGSEGSGRAADFAAKRAKLAQASLHVVHVLEWSAYSFLTPEELEERHKRRRDELERAEKHIIAPIVARLAADGHTVTSEVRYGHVAKTLNEVANEQQATLIYIAKASESKLATMVLGSVPGTLIQIAAVPVAVVP